MLYSTYYTFYLIIPFIMTLNDEYELLKTTYLFNATKYIDAINHYKLEHFSESGVK